MKVNILLDLWLKPPESMSRNPTIFLEFVQIMANENLIAVYFSIRILAIEREREPEKKSEEEVGTSNSSSSSSAEQEP
jgi:hypothetical protein